MSSREIRAAIRQAKAEAAQEISSLRDALSDAQRDSATANAAYENCAKDRERYCTQRDNVLADFAERDKECKVVKKKLKRSQADLSKCMGERNAYMDAMSEAQSQKLKWQDCHKKSERELAKTHRHLTKRTEVCAALKKELAAARTSYTEEFATYQGHMQKELTKALANDNATEMKKELAAANRQTKKAKAAYENCAKDRERYRTERDDAQKKLEDARAVKKQAKARLTKLQTTAKALQADIVRKDEAMASLKKGHDVLKKENRQLAAQVRKRKRDDDSMTPQRLLETALKKMKQTHTDWYTNVPREFDDPMYILKWKQYGMKWRKERGSGRMQYSAALKDAAGHPPLWNNVAEAKRAVAKMEQRAASSKN